MLHLSQSILYEMLRVARSPITVPPLFITTCLKTPYPSKIAFSQRLKGHCSTS